MKKPDHPPQIQIPAVLMLILAGMGGCVLSCFIVWLTWNYFVAYEGWARPLNAPAALALTVIIGAIIAVVYILKQTPDKE